MNKMEPRELSAEEINAIYLNGYKPIGLFYCLNGDTVIGVDNSTGDAFTEEFPSLAECLAWLRREVEPHEAQ